MENFKNLNDLLIKLSTPKKLRVGMVIRLPFDMSYRRDEPPTWTHGMDKYLNREFTIKSIRRGFWVELHGVNGSSFNENWLTYVSG